MQSVTIATRVFNFTDTRRRTGQHPFGGADRLLPEWIQWGGGGVVAQTFSGIQIQWGGG